MKIGSLSSNVRLVAIILTIGFNLPFFQTSSQQTIRAQTSTRDIQIRQWPDKSKRWALLIGINKYLDDTHLQNLNAAVNDAKALKEVLVKYSGFPESQVILLTSDQPEKFQPTRNNILREMGILGKNIPQDGLLLFAFSGHGMERAGQVFLAPSDTQIIVLEQTALSATMIMDMVKAAGVSQIVLVLDACRNNPIGRGVIANPLTEMYKHAFDFDQRNQGVTAFATLYATGVGQVSQENPATGQGYFTEAIVEGLKGAAANEKGEVTLKALIDYVEDIVPRRTRRVNAEEQKPFENIYGYKANELVISVAETRSLQNGTSLDSNFPSNLKTDPSEMSEVVFWNSIASSKNPSKFEAYLEQYPNGRYAKLAKITLNELGKKQTDDQSGGGKITSNNPARPQETGQSHQEADRKAEQADWEAIRSSNDPASLKEYLHRYPNGIFASVAQSRFDELTEIAYWNSIISSTDPETFNVYLRRFPGGKFTKQAKAKFDELTEITYWDSILNSENTELFDEYLRRYPNGKFAEKARNKLNQQKARIEEKAERAYWTSIANNTTSEAFAEYLQRYPKGIFARLAQTRLNELAEEAYWAKISTRLTVDSCSEYLKRYPNGKFANQVKVRLNELIEESDWNSVVNRTDPQAFDDYLRHYPNGRFAEKARSRLELQTEIMYWNSIAHSTNPDAFKEYLRRYPNGRYATVAKDRANAKAPELPPVPTHNTTGQPSAALTSIGVKTADQYAAAGNKFGKEGLWEKAEAEFRQAVKLEPNSAMWHTLTAVALSMEKKELEAETEFRRAVQLEPQKPQTHANLGRILEKQMKFVEAETEFRESIKIDPRTAEWHGDLGFILLLQQKWGEAESAYREALRLEPANPKWHTGAGAALLGQHEVDQAEVEYRKAIDIEPEKAQWHADLAFLLSQKQNWTEAKKEYGEAIRLDPKNASHQEGLKQLLKTQESQNSTEPTLSSTKGENPLLDNSGDVKPILLNSPLPEYTETARKKKVKGIVTARVLVGEDGIVKKFEIIKGLPEGLNEEAEIAAHKMRFRPAMKNGIPTEMWISIQIEFKLR